MWTNTQWVRDICHQEKKGSKSASFSLFYGSSSLLTAQFKGGHQKEDVLAEQPEAFQVDYELDPPVLFSINPDDNRGLLGGFKSLAEELMDATEQPMNQQPLNQHLVLVSQPAPENPSPRSIGKVKNGCVLDKQIFEEIEMIAPTAGEATLEVTSLEGYRDSNIK
ncbi:UNVERIFIED_CONTAM: hypothetical protein K2H54_004087 [Gekko kuhli]